MRSRGTPLRLALVHSSIVSPAKFHRNAPISALQARDLPETQIFIPQPGHKELAAMSSLKSRVDVRHRRAHAIHTQINLSLRRFMIILLKRNLPRSRPPPLLLLPHHSIDLWQHAWKFFLRLVLECISAAVVFTLASSILFAKISSKFVATSVVRWMILSIAIRMCKLQSSIASLAYLASDDCYFSGHFDCVSSEDAIPVKIRKNIGYGSCLFHSIAASILTEPVLSDCTHGNDWEFTAHPSHSEVIAHSSVLRDIAVAALINGIETNAQMVLQQNETISASTLVNEAAGQFSMTAEEYLSEMRHENVWGGGPEMVAVSNSLNRQIVLLETMRHGYFLDNTTYLEVRARLGPQSTVRPIYILSTDQRFPKYYDTTTKNHFLAVIPLRPF